MAKKRTKADKQAAEQRRKMTYSLDDVESPSRSSRKVAKKNASKTASEENIFGYSTEFIQKDLLKTVGVTAIIVALLIAITVLRSELIL